MDRLVKLSKFLSWVLRHGALELGLEFIEGCYLYVEDILDLQQVSGKYSEKDVKDVIAKDDKKRFDLKVDSMGKLLIRACQGHSLAVSGLSLKEVSDWTKYKTVLHGTYYKCWPLIRDAGLSKMNRNYIHFAHGLPGEAGVMSGMRQSCQLLIAIDIAKAIQDGIKFYQSVNNVILTEGVDGFLHPRYFLYVKDRKSGAELPVH